jgi:hypothetical protein
LAHNFTSPSEFFFNGSELARQVDCTRAIEVPGATLHCHLGRAVISVRFLVSCKCVVDMVLVSLPTLHPLGS